MYPLWNSQLFFMYQTVEAMTLGTTVGLCCLYSSSALLTYSLVSCWMQGFPVSYGSTLWEGRKSQSLFCSEIPLSHLLLLVWTQLWSSGFNPERQQCARPLFTSSQRARPSDVSLTKWWENCSLDIQFSLRGFLLCECFVLSPLGFGF